MLDRLWKCVALVPRVLSKDDPDAVHDLRVWTRRSQQLIVALFREPRPSETRVIMKALRRARHSLGVWRDCDVLIALLERKAQSAMMEKCAPKIPGAEGHSQHYPE